MYYDIGLHDELINTDYLYML